MSQYTRVASTDEQEESIVEVERWTKKINKRIVGGKKIGKYTQTLILDLTHYGSEIYINSNGDITVNDIHVHDFDAFKNAVNKGGD